jgi:hypothetical protein
MESGTRKYLVGISRVDIQMLEIAMKSDLPDWLGQRVYDYLNMNSTLRVRNSVFPQVSYRQGNLLFFTTD